jgi:hypothetical protein
MKSARIPLLVAALGWAAASCDRPPQALGTANSIIVIATDSAWAAFGDAVEAALEPRIYTVRSERTFEVTHIAPSDPNWTELRNFRQVVALGDAGDAWVQPIVDKAQTSEAVGQDRVARANDVWVRNQLAIAVVLSSADRTAAQPALERVGAVLDSLFRVQTIQRMYTSRPDSALRDTLRAVHQFGLLLPNVYSVAGRSDSHLHYQNNTRVGGDLVRSVLVTWREGVIEPGVDTAVAWRDSIAATLYQPPQRTLREQVLTVAVTSADGTQGLEVQGAWEGTDPSWPMGGLFISRMIPCAQQNRTFLLDTWLYAPGPRRSKYEYMIQLQTILGTFEC